MVQVQISQLAILFHCIGYWIGLDWIGLDWIWIWIWFNSITYTFQWDQFGLDWIVQSKRVKIKGRIYPWVLTNARRINPFSVRMCTCRTHGCDTVKLPVPVLHLNLVPVCEAVDQACAQPAKGTLPFCFPFIFISWYPFAITFIHVAIWRSPALWLVTLNSLLMIVLYMIWDFYPCRSLK